MKTSYNHALTVLKFLVVFALLGFAELSWSQGQFVSDNYLLDDYLLNPAMTGRNKHQVKLRTGFREQWMRIKDSPSTQFLTAHSSIGKKYGIGTAIFSDQNGSHVRTGGQVSFGYHTKLNYKSELSLGLSASLWQRKVDLGTSTDGISDPALLNIAKSFTTANANFGAFYVYHSKIYVGFSALNLIPLKESVHPDEPNQPQNFCLTAGYRYVSKNLKYRITPSALLSYSTNGKKEFDLNSIFEIKSRKKAKSYALGFSLRYSWFAGADRVVAILPSIGGRHYNWEVRYVYQQQIAGPQLFNYGTHSIMLGYRIPLGKMRPE